MSGSRMRVALLLLLIFAAGAAAGVAADRFRLFSDTADANTARTDRAAGAARSGRERQTTIERFADDLGLSTSQRGKIDDILERYRTKLKAMREQVRPRFHALVDSVRTEIESTLTPEQVAEYRTLLEQRRGQRNYERNSSENENKEKKD